MSNLLGIDNQTLQLLFELLKGDTELRESRSLTKQAEQALQKVEQILSQRQAHRIVDIL